MQKEYTISWLEQKTTSTGKSYMSVTLEGEDDKKITIWSDFPNFANLLPSSRISGVLKQNDKGYWNLYPPTPVSAPKSGGFGGVAKAQERKSEMIQNAQDNKEMGIKIASTMNGAVQITIAMMKDDKTVIWTDGIVKDEIKKWRQFLWLNWDAKDTDFPPVE